MNTHIPTEIKDKWPTYEFKGVPFVLRNGKKYIRAYHKSLGQVHFYDFESDFFWWDREDILS